MSKKMASEGEQMQSEQQPAQTEGPAIENGEANPAGNTCPAGDEFVTKIPDYEGEAEKYKTQADEYLQLLQRVQADFDNFRKRTQQEREDWSKYCSARIVTNLLPVLDNFERALHAAGSDVHNFLEGMQLIYRQLRDVLEKEGVMTMETVGKEFDPNLHEAVMQAPSAEYPDNTVIEEFQKGYLLADRVIRPAMVKVAKN